MPRAESTTPPLDPGLVEIALNPSSDFWERLAAELVVRPRLCDWIIVVPGAAHGALLRSALARQAPRRAGTSLRLPRIATLSELAGADSAGSVSARTESARRIELFAALKASDWLRRHLELGTQTLWGMARQLIALCDELTLGLAAGAARGESAPIEARILAAIKGTYRARAWEACSAETQLVLDVWRATLSREDGPALFLRSLEQLARRAPAPLMVIRTAPWRPHEAAFFGRYASLQRVECVVPDSAAGLAGHPALAAAWPELLGANEAHLDERARRLAAAGRPLLHVQLGACNSLEEQATRAAQQVLDWLTEGCQRIGVVALDRVVARRMRALLERADVLVRDEAGWKFSTTAVAGALMRWLELASQDEARCDTGVLLDWLKSPHALCAVPHKQAALAEIELTIRRQRILRDLGALAAALVRDAPDGVLYPERAAARVSARAVIADVRQWLARRATRTTFVGHFEWLLQSLTQTGMRKSFENDVGGVQLLELVARLIGEAHRQDGAPRFGFAEWRDFVADALENASFRDDSITSPVCVVDFTGASLRDFDALLMLGADSEHFPVRDEGALFLTPSLRVELGLEERDAELHNQLWQLALLFAATPRVLATWQASVNGERRAPANALLRLSLVHGAAFHDPLYRDWTWPLTRYRQAPVAAPLPSAAVLLPDEVSATQYASLTRCPYQYYVRHLLQLSDLEDPREEVSQRDYGILVHRILERFHQDADAGAAPLLVARLEEVSRSVFDELVGDNPAFLGYRQRWRSLIEPYVEWWLGRRARGWRLVATEQRESVQLTVEGGGRALTLVGRLDRIDQGPEGLSIVDYKARTVKALKDALATPGEDIQLPFYRLLLPEAQRVAACYLSVDKVRVDEVAAPQELEALSRAVASRLARDFERLAAGAPLPALGVERVCQYCEARGLCRKGEWSDSPVSAAR